VVSSAVSGRSLPPGQHASALRRFGLPQYAGVRPHVLADPVLTVTGMVRHPLQLAVAELAEHPGRREQVADLHCVTTWSARDLRWSGLPFAAVHDLLVARAAVRSSARWVCFAGLDGYRNSLLLADCLAEGVLLADTLGGAPLTAETGAPLRLVAPAHYGYKSVKHLYAIEYRCHYDPGPAGWMGHPRGRVAYEERSRYLPGRAWRPVWRLALPLVRRTYDRQPRG